MPVDAARIPSHYVTPAAPDARPGWMERIGRRYFEQIAAQQRDRPELHLGAIETVSAEQERRLAARGRRETWLAMGVALVAGAISAWGSVWVGIATEAQGFWWNYFWIGLVTAVLSAIEFAVLFWLSLWLVARQAVLSGADSQAADPVYRNDRVSGLLARAALEIPDPVMHILGIDPLERVSRQRLWLVGLIYKLKIALSNVVARIVLTRLLGRYVLRVSVAYVAVPITGLWNAWVTYKVARDARLRLNGQAVVAGVKRQLAAREARAPLSPLARLAALQAAGNVVVLTQNYHPNMLLLLLALLDELGAPPPREVPRLDDWGSLLQNLAALPPDERRLVLNLLSVAAALDGTFSDLERRELDEAFGAEARHYYARIVRLRDALSDSRLIAARELADLAHSPKSSTPTAATAAA